MKAIVQEKYGSPYDVLNLKDIGKPVLKDDEVLVRVHAASVHPDVWHLVRGLPYVLRLMGAGLLRPKNSVPGTDVAGHVEWVGKNVSQFQQGDEVFGETIKGYQWTNGGAYAEYVSVPEDSLLVSSERNHTVAVFVNGLCLLHTYADTVGLFGERSQQFPKYGSIEVRERPESHSENLVGINQQYLTRTLPEGMLKDL
jgi:NADPH:quinone reductase-like Zn-dependent oxidoreductase